MNLILLYCAKLVLVSGFLFGYYWFFLRNAPFHGYNRCYLLGVTGISLVLPFLHIPIPGLEYGATPSTIAVLHSITVGDWGESVTLTRHPGFWRSLFNGSDPSYWIYVAGIYTMVACALLLILLRSLRYIYRLSKKSPVESVDGIHIFLTREPGTPFSFLNGIFWNEGLDIHSPRGNQVFRHELYHVRQKHTADILALELLNSVFWFNPFFHLIRREIKATHEFLADQYAISSSDKYEYAELLVWQTLGSHQLPVVHSFFNTHLKRRIAMLTRLKNTRPGYFSRIMVLPLVFLLFCAFATSLRNHTHSSQPLGKPLTVVIDAGHGGSDPGAISSGGINEKDLTLSIAKKIQQLSSAYNINVLMTRDEDKLPGNKTAKEDALHFRTEFANEHKADLFISIHVNNNGGSTDPNGNGIQVWLSAQNIYFQKSQSLGSAMIEEMKKAYPTDDQMKQRTEGLLVLQASAMPAILLECGNMDNAADLAYITNPQNQQTIARSILQGIIRYEETPPIITSGPTAPAVPIPAPPVPAVRPLAHAVQDSVPVPSAVGRPDAEYPGGQDAWIKYLNQNFKYPEEAVAKKVQGKVIIQFRVSTDGTVSEIKEIGKDPGSGLGAEAIRMIALSGKWKPALVNGIPSVSYKKQPIVYRLD